MVTRRNDERTVAGRHRMMRRADREVTEPQPGRGDYRNMQDRESCIHRCGRHHHRAVEFSDTCSTRNPIISPCISMVLRPDEDGRGQGRQTTRFPWQFEMATDCEVVEDVRCAIGASVQVDRRQWHRIHHRRS